MVCKVGVVHIGGQGASKKEAKRKSASEMLQHLAEAGDGAHALVFEVKKEEPVREDSKVGDLGKAVRDLSLDVQASKLQDLQTMSLEQVQKNLLFQIKFNFS